MPTLRNCKSVNNCSPNLLLFKVARYEKLYFGPFFFALRLGPALHSCLFILHNAHAHHALPWFLTTPCSAFALPDFDMSPCPALSCPVLSSSALTSPALPANSPISGRSDRKVLRLIYIYVYTYLGAGKRPSPLDISESYSPDLYLKVGFYLIKKYCSCPKLSQFKDHALLWLVPAPIYTCCDEKKVVV